MLTMGPSVYTTVTSALFDVSPLYEDVSKSFRTESITKYTLTIITALVGKQHNGL